MNAADFRAAVETVPELTLEAVVLLREYRQTGELPDDTIQVARAVRELEAYRKCCDTFETLVKNVPMAASCDEEFLLIGFVL